MSSDGTSFELTPNEKKRRLSADQSQIDSVNDKIKELQAGKDAIDKIYTSMTIPTATSSNDHITANDDTSGSSSKGKSADTLAKEADKSAIKEITDTYDKAKESITEDVDDITAKLDELGDDVTPSDKVDAYTQQITKQTELLGKAKDELTSLEGVSVSTSEGQTELETATKKANTEIRSQESAIRKLNTELKSLATDNIKKMIEEEKALAEKRVENKQTAEKTQLETTDYKTNESAYNTYKTNKINGLNEEIDKINELKDAGMDITTAKEATAEIDKQIKELEDETYDTVKDTQSLYEKIQAEKTAVIDDEISSIEDKISAMEEANSEESKATELASKKLAVTTAETTLAEKQLALTKAQTQLSVKNYTQNADGSWGFTYSSSKTAVDSAQTEVDSAQTSLTDAKTALSDYKEQQAYEDELQALKDQETELKSQQTAITELTATKKTQYDEDLKNLEKNQAKEKDALTQSYADMDTLVKTRFDQLKKTYGDSWSGIITDVQTQTMKAQVELNKLTNLNITYTVSSSSASPSSSTTASTDSSASSSSSSSGSSSITKAVESQYNDVKEYGTKIEDSVSSNAKTVETTQSTSYTNQLNNLKTFATSYVTLTDKFLELLEIVYDFRYSGITSLAEMSTGLIVDGLIVAEKAFEKYQEIEKAMGVDTDSISISDITDSLASYKQSVSDWTSSKSSLYSSDAFSTFASQISSSLSSTLTSSLSSALSSITSSATSTSTTSNSTTDSGTTVTIQNVSVDGVTNVDSFMTELTTKINQLINLKS